jgi:hypothetical protein
MPAAQPALSPSAHPFDEHLASRNLLGWGRPLFELIKRHALLLFGVLIAYALIQWALPHLRFSSPLFESRLWPRIVDWLVAVAISSAAFAFAFALLARSEGARYGLTAIEPWPSIAGRAFGLGLLWSVVSALIVLAFLLAGYVVFRAFGSAGSAGGGNALAFFLLLGATFVFVGAAAVVLLAPLWVGLALRYYLSFVRIVRTNEGPITAFRLAWQRVSDEAWRHFWPAYALVAIFVALSVAAYFAPQSPALTIVSLACVLLMFAAAVALGFIVERVYDPSLGLEPGIEYAQAQDAVDSPPSAPTSQTPGRSAAPAAAARAAASSTTSSARAPTATSATAATANATGIAPSASDPSASSLGPPLSPTEFAALAAKHTYSPREMRGLLGRCTDKLAGLVALRPELLKLAQGPRVSEVAMLLEAALTADPRFYVADPDDVTPLAKRIATVGRPDLAVKLLQPYVREQREHKSHLTGALFAAHLVAHQLKKPAAARQFLLQLQKLYPAEAMIEQQLKRLPTQ